MSEGTNDNSRNKPIALKQRSSRQPGMKLIFRSLTGDGEPILDLPIQNLQAHYLRCLVKDLGAVSALVEPNYFDADYLAQHKEVLSESTNGYVNVCQRIHYFKGKGIDRRRLKVALGGKEQKRTQTVLKELQEDYLGFVVIRPISSVPFGRTVLKLKDFSTTPNAPLIIKTARRFYVNIVGLPFWVEGIPWQEQEYGAGRCGTVAIWSAFQSCALEGYQCPSTPEITREAGRVLVTKGRIFPAYGMTIQMMLEAIRSRDGLAPILIRGNIEDPGLEPQGFTKSQFAHLCACYLDGGFSVILYGRYQDNKEIGGQPNAPHHINLVTAYESSPPDPLGRDDMFNCHDSSISHLRIHDDAIGPGARFAIEEQETSKTNNTKRILLCLDFHDNSVLKTDCPDMNVSDVAFFAPKYAMIIAPIGMRLSPRQLLFSSRDKMFLLAGANYLCPGEDSIAQQKNLRDKIKPQFSYSCRFLSQADYLHHSLEQTLGRRNSNVLANTRLALIESIQPMSKYLGLVRIGYRDSTRNDYWPLLDILFDTTDLDQNHAIFCHIVYHEKAKDLIEIAQTYSKEIKRALEKINHFELESPNLENFGIQIKAY